MTSRLKLLSIIGILFAMLLLLIDSSTFMLAFSRGISAWAISVLPAILPFMILCKMLSTLTPPSNRKLPLNLPQGSASIILLSCIAGYPMGAKLISASFNSGNMNTDNCIKTSILSSTASPIFIIGTVGGSLLSNSSYGVIILVSTLLGAVVNYMLYYNRYNTPSPACTTDIMRSDDNIIIDSLMAVLMVGVHIALFSVLCQMIMYVLPQWFSTQGILLTSYILGLLEMTTGCINICAVASSATSAVLCCSLVSFGGLCITMQCMTFYKLCNIKYGTVLKIKLTHCALSTIICYMLIALL